MRRCRVYFELGAALRSMFVLTEARAEEQQ
jgi:hypothetical protein